MNQPQTVRPPGSIFPRLMQTIEDRRANPPQRSYTTSLFQGGVDKIGGKMPPW